MLLLGDDLLLDKVVAHWTRQGSATCIIAEPAQEARTIQQPHWDGE